MAGDISGMSKSETTAKPSKKVISALGRVFAAEIEGRLLFQSKAGIYRDLMAAGLVEPIQRQFGTGALAVTVSGYALTVPGHYIYCSNCGDDDE